jgi:hypothetical protein
MKPSQFAPRSILKPFARRKILTKAQLRQACGCSAMTAWRALHREGYLTSYNHNAADLDTVLSYLQKYRHNLVGHVIPRPGREPLVVERTNNVSEHRFAAAKRGLRRKLGTKKLARLIQAMCPEELLLADLDDPQYLEILCGGHLENLSTSFAQNWRAGHVIRTERRKKNTNHPIPTSKKILRDGGFLPCLRGAVHRIIEILRGGRCAA